MSCGYFHFHIITSSPSSKKTKKEREKEGKLRSGLSSYHLYVCECVCLYVL